MDIGVWIVFGLIGTFCILPALGVNAIERRRQSMRPPDDWDGMREDEEKDRPE